MDIYAMVIGKTGCWRKGEILKVIDIEIENENIVYGKSIDTDYEGYVLMRECFQVEFDKKENAWYDTDGNKVRSGWRK